MSNSIGKNAIFNILYRSLSVVFPLVTVSYASRILSPAGVGVVSSTQNFSSYFVVFASLGIPTYGIRAVAQARRDDTEKNRTITELLSINFICSMICAAIFYTAVFTFDYFSANRPLYLIFSSLIVLNVFSIGWILQGFEEYKYIAMRSFVTKVVSMIALFIFVKTPKDVAWYAVIVCFGIAGNYIFNVFWLSRRFKFDFSGLDYKRHFKPILIFFISVLAVDLYSMLDVTMLTVMTDSTHVGYYSNAVKIVKTLATTMTAAGIVLLPRLSIYYQEHRTREIKESVDKMLKAILLITVPSCLGIMALADNIVLAMFGKEFAEAAMTLRILCPLVVLMPVSGGVGAQILQTTSNEKKYLIGVIAGAAANAVLNYFAIQLFSQNGAAMASLATELLVLVLFMLFSRKIVKVSLGARYYLELGISALVMCAAVIPIKLFLAPKSNVAALIVSVIAGIAVYAVMLIILKNETAMEYLGKIKKKFGKR